MKHNVSIIIPNWNGVELLKKNLASIKSASQGCEIIIVDDGSADDSVSYIKKKHPDIHLIEKPNNDGYASAVNTGVSNASGDIVVLLNTDTRPEKNYLKPLLTHFSNVQVFAVGCMDKSHEGDEVVLRGRGVSSWTRGMYVHERGDVSKTDTSWISGGSGAFRKSYWKTLGGMDTLFNPFYWEDIDLSYRALKTGYIIKFEPRSVVAHFHETGKIKTSFTDYRVKTIAYRNQYIFVWKNITDKDIIVSHILWTPARLVRAVLSGDTAHILGYISALARLPWIWMARRHLDSFWKLSDRNVPLARDDQ